jgi:DNA-directed RNA polymerase subunit RPC12/RpoP
MAGVPLKFRCYQCNQLLGVPRSKAGRVISCPKCSAELLVPQAAESTSAAGGGGLDIGIDLTAPTASESGIDLDLLDIRPEDIRVEPGVVLEEPPTPPPPEPTTPEPDVPDVPPPPELAAHSTVVVPPVPVVEEAQPEAAPVVPPIQVEPLTVAPERPATARARDVVLPRSVVASWSLFVLVAQGLAFVAGLLAGHYLWRVH